MGEQCPNCESTDSRQLAKVRDEDGWVPFLLTCRGCGVVFTLPQEIDGIELNRII